MTVALPAPAAPRPLWRLSIRLVGFAGLAALTLLVALGDVLAPAGAAAHGPILAAPAPAFPFGTDILGRGLVSETLHGLTVTLVQGLVAVVLILVLGGLAGFLAARLHWRGGALLRLAASVLGAVPPLLLAILLIGVAGRDWAPIAAGLAISPLAFARTYDRARRMGRSRHAFYAQATGISGLTLLRRDLTYDFKATFLADAARALAASLIILSTVSFLGFGAAPPQRDLGLMIAAALPNYQTAWWTALFPALALVLLVLFARLAAGLDEGERA